MILKKKHWVFDFRLGRKIKYYGNDYIFIIKNIFIMFYNGAGNVHLRLEVYNSEHDISTFFFVNKNIISDFKFYDN